MHRIQISEVKIDVIQKDIKNVHLSVYPPSGKVKISAPNRMDLETIRVYAISRLSWIRNQQKKFRDQEREAPRDYISNESHFYNGKRYLLKVIEHNAPAKVELKHSAIELYVRPNSSIEKKQAVLEDWYRHELKSKVTELIPKWEERMNLSVNEFGVKKMRTKWGTCNSEKKRIWLNLELAKKPPHCVEYILVHEMVHFFEKNHNEIFIAYMNKYMPKWRSFKQELNKIPLGFVEWGE
jgi:predicted metal-dependent hydrolase